MRKWSTDRLRTVLISFALTAAGAAGWTVAGFTPSASADGLLPTIPVPPLPVPVPSLPISVPDVPLPGGSTTTTTTATSTATQTTTVSAAGTAGTQTQQTTTSAAADPPPAPAEPTGTEVAGVVRLADGRLSIPMSSIAAPTRLVLVKVSLTPRAIRTKRTHLVLVLRVRDSRGYLVRGAVVRLTGTSLRTVTGTSKRKTGTAGLVRFSLETTARLVLRPRATVTLVAQTGRPGTAPAKVATAIRRVTVPIEPLRARPTSRKR
jgi:hypothetical protein